MTKKSICLTFFVLLLVSVGNVDAAVFRYTDAGADHLWSNPYNWEATVPSDYGSHDAQMQLDGTICEITTGTQASCRGCYIGCYGHTNEMYMTGGSLECRWLNVGRGRETNTNGYFEMTGGVVNAQNLDIPNAFNNNPDYIAVGTAKVHGGR